MGKTGPTDVLSFPLLPPAAFRASGDAACAGRAVRLPPGSRLHLGDIVVSVERAIEQAATGRGGQTGDVRWSPADELRLLVTHGDAPRLRLGPRRARRGSARCARWSSACWPTVRPRP